MTRLFMIFSPLLLLVPLLLIGLIAVVVIVGGLRDYPVITTMTSRDLDYRVEIFDTEMMVAHRVPIVSDSEFPRVTLLPDGRHVMLMRRVINGAELIVVDMLDGDRFTAQMPSAFYWAGWVSEPDEGRVMFYDSPQLGMLTLYLVDYDDQITRMTTRQTGSLSDRALMQRQAIEAYIPDLFKRLSDQYGPISRVERMPDKDWFVFYAPHGRWQHAYTVHIPSQKVYRINAELDTSVDWVKWHNHRQIVYAVKDHLTGSARNAVYLASATLENRQFLAEDAGYHLWAPHSDQGAYIALDYLDTTSGRRTGHTGVFSPDGETITEAIGDYLLFNAEGNQLAIRQQIGPAQDYVLTLISLEDGRQRELVGAGAGLVSFAYLYEEDS